MADNEFNYWAFLGFSQQDNCGQRPDTGDVSRRCWGNWLQDALKNFFVPPEFIGQVNGRGEIIPERLAPVFQDEAEIPGDTDLKAETRQALTESRCLIVICSPRSAQSLQVNAAVRYFKQLGRSQQIFPIVIAGEPNAGDGHQPGSSPEDECFVPALRHAVLPDGTIDTTRPAGRYIFVDARYGVEKREILARDHRNAEADLETAKIHLIALLLGVGFHGLWAREQKRHFIDLTEVQHQAREALNQAEEARRQIREAQNQILETQNLPRDVQSQIEAAQTKAQEAQSQFYEAQKQLQEFQNQNRETQSQLEEARHRVVIAEDKVLEAQNQTREAQHQAEQAGLQLQAACSQIQGNPDANQEIQRQAEEARRQLHEVQNQTLEAQNQFHEIQKQLQEFQNKDQETQSQLEAARYRVVITESKVLEAQNQVREAQHQAEQAGLQLQAARSQVQEKLNEIQEVQRQAENTRHQFSEIQSRALEAQNQFNEVQKQLQEFQNKDQETQGQLETARRRVLAAESKILEAQRQAEQNGFQLQEARSQVQEKLNEIQVAQRQAEDARRQLQEVQNQSRQAQVQVQETQNKSRRARRLTRALALIAVLALMSAGVATDIAWSQRKIANQALAKIAAQAVWEPDLTQVRMDQDQIRQALNTIEGIEQENIQQRSLDKLAAWIPVAKIPETLNTSAIILDDQQRTRFQKRLLIRLGWVNPLSAMAGAGAIEGKIISEEGKSDSGSYFQLAVLNNWMQTDLPGAFSWVCQLPDDAARSRALAKIIPAMAVNPQSTLAQLNDLKPAAAGQIYTLLFQRWAAQDPVQAIQLWQQIPDRDPDGEILCTIMAAWMNQSLDVTWNQVKSQPDLITAIGAGWFIWRVYAGMERN